MNDNEDALTCLKDYISSSEPKVNKDLRSEKPNLDIQNLDNLFEYIVAKTTVYRGLPSRYISDNLDEYQDMGYVSTSKDVTEALRFALEEDPCLLVFKLKERYKVIDVMKHLTDCNNEEEYILPHGQKYQVINKERYSRKETDLSFKEFEAKFQPNENMNCFESLNVFYLQPFTD